MRSFKNTYYDIKRHHNHTLEFLNSSISFIDISTVERRLMERGETSYDKFLTDWEYAYKNEIKIPKRRIDFLSGRLAAKRAIRRHIEKNTAQNPLAHNNVRFSDIEIRRTVTGRPMVFIKDGSSRNGLSDFLISISHTQGVAASLACHKSACKGIGIDIEKIESKDDSLLDVAFTDNEIRLLEEYRIKGNGRGHAMFEENLARFWSIKEAAMKSMGVGVNIDLKDIEVSDIESYSSIVELKNEAQSRFSLLEGAGLKVESTKIEKFMISIACLY